MNPFLATDGYKVGHHKMYPKGTTLVYSNFTPRTNKYAPKGCDKVVSFGQQMVMKQIDYMFHAYFFGSTKDKVCQEIKKEYSLFLGTDYDVSHIEALWDLGYLPIEVKTIPEGTLVPMGVPVLTIKNTLPEFYWLTNFLETLISNLLWKPMTSATIAHQYKKNLTKWALKTDEKNLGFVEFQGHDFSMRGLDSIDATISSGLGHATSFLGSDSLPVIHGARKYYHEEGGVIHSVNATEHSVMCAGTKDDEIGTFRYLMKQFPTGILSIVSDTWDLWKVCTEILPQLKDEILARDGKIVIRPDSGDPVDIICGIVDVTEYIEDIGESLEVAIMEFGYPTRFIYKGVLYSFDKKTYNRHDLEYGEQRDWMSEDYVVKIKDVDAECKGVVELLWDIFGGTINEQGFKVLDPHIGAIYGDSITIDRAEQICQRLSNKGFASTNIVLGVGSFTYQFNTRDTFGFAMKATYCEMKQDLSKFEMQDFPQSVIDAGYVIESREIFKDPITDDGTKKSAKGLLQVFNNNPNCNGGEWLNDGNDVYALNDGVTWEQEKEGLLQTIFKDGKFYNKVTLTEIRARVCGL